MARQVGKDSPVDIKSPVGTINKTSTYAKPSQKGVNLTTPSPGPLTGKTNTGGPRFRGGSPLKSPSPTKGVS